MKSLAVSINVAIAVLSLTSLRAESLTYAISWPSGLSLGEATLTSDQKPSEPKADPKREAADPKAPEPKAPATDPKTAGPWSFHLDLTAGVPGFSIRDNYQSTASAGLCSAELKKSVSHGGRRVEETVIFDPHKNTATRQIANGGGTTEIDVPACAHDPLAFIQFARTELARGRMAPQQAVIFGAAYQVRMVLTGTEAVMVDGKRTDTDHLQATIKGPSREYTIELYFARDPLRTPVLARIPLPLGAFTAELMR